MNFIKKFGLFLSPTISNGILTIMFLPIITKKLDPSDYGQFLIFLSLITFVANCSMHSFEFIITKNFQKLKDNKFRDLIFNSFLISISISLFIFLIAVTYYFLYYIHKIEINYHIFILTSFLIHISGQLLWGYSKILIPLTSSEKWFSLIVISQGVTFNVGQLFLLNYLDNNKLLFVASNLSNLLLCILCLIYLKKRSLIGSFDKKSLKPFLTLGPVTTAVSIIESLILFLERYIITTFMNLEKLGVYGHSQMYKNLVWQCSKAAYLVIWPISLLEAKDCSGEFLKTNTFTKLINYSLMALFFLLTLIGEYLIDFLGNGKFNLAYPLLLGWVVVMMSQNSGRPIIASIYESGLNGKLFYILNGTSKIIFIILLFLSVRYLPFEYIWIPLFIAEISFRLSIWIFFQKRKKVPNERFILFSIFFVIISIFFQGSLPTILYLVLFILFSYLSLKQLFGLIKVIN